MQRDVMTIPNAMIFAITINLVNTKLSPALLLHCGTYGEPELFDVEFVPIKRKGFQEAKVFKKCRTRPRGAKVSAAPLRCCVLSPTRDHIFIMYICLPDGVRYATSDLQQGSICRYHLTMPRLRIGTNRRASASVSWITTLVPSPTLLLPKITEGIGAKNKESTTRACPFNHELRPMCAIVSFALAHSLLSPSSPWSKIRRYYVTLIAASAPVRLDTPFTLSLIETPRCQSPQICWNELSPASIK